MSIKSKVGRKSARKSTLAILREKLVVWEPVKDRPGLFLQKDQISVETVAQWLNLKADSVRQIERRRVTLTRENAEVIGRQTNVDLQWLLANDTTKPIINFLKKRTLGVTSRWRKRI